MWTLVSGSRAKQSMPVAVTCSERQLDSATARSDKHEATKSIRQEERFGYTQKSSAESRPHNKQRYTTKATDQDKCSNYDEQQTAQQKHKNKARSTDSFSGGQQRSIVQVQSGERGALAHVRHSVVTHSITCVDRLRNKTQHVSISTWQEQRGKQKKIERETDQNLQIMARQVGETVLFTQNHRVREMSEQKADTLVKRHKTKQEQQLTGVMGLL